MCAIDETSERRDTKMKRRMEKTKNKERERERENKGSKKNAARGVVRVVTCLDATAHPSSSRLERERERDLFVIPFFSPREISFQILPRLFCLHKFYTNLSLVWTKTLIIKANTNVFFPSQRRVLFVRSFVRGEDEDRDVVLAF